MTQTLTFPSFYFRYVFKSFPLTCVFKNIFHITKISPPASFLVEEDIMTSAKMFKNIALNQGSCFRRENIQMTIVAKTQHPSSRIMEERYESWSFNHFEVPCFSFLVPITNYIQSLQLRTILHCCMIYIVSDGSSHQLYDFSVTCSIFCVH